MQNTGGPQAPFYSYVDSGIPLLELVALDELAADGIAEFLFVMGALPIVGATGTPVNPIPASTMLW